MSKQLTGTEKTSSALTFYRGMKSKVFSPLLIQVIHAGWRQKTAFAGWLLRGKPFLEPSTRTRLAFEVAAKQLGADTVTVTGDASSLTKGERSAILPETWRPCRPIL